MKPGIIPLNAPDHVLAAMLDVWRETGRISSMTVYGKSMEPRIPKGTKVLVEHRCDRIEPGDVVVFKNDDHLTAHRVVAVHESAGGRVYTTQGDANPEPDEEPLPERWIVGKVTGIQDG